MFKKIMYYKMPINVLAGFFVANVPSGRLRCPVAAIPSNALAYVNEVP